MHLRNGVRAVVAITLGGTVIGLGIGLVFSFLYQFLRERTTRENTRLREAAARVRAMRQSTGAAPKTGETAGPNGQAKAPKTGKESELRA